LKNGEFEMKNFFTKFFALISVFTAISFAQHTFPITSFPTWVIVESEMPTITLKFPDFGNQFTYLIRFSRNPSGAVVANYADSIRIQDAGVSTSVENGIREITFHPKDIPNFRAGINYLIVHARPISGNTGITDEISNEVKIILAHTEQNRNLQIDGRVSGAIASSTTPRLSWTKPAGVPFSHVVLSDEEIKIGTDANGNLSVENIEGISMIWQAITRDNSIVYGEPDPSGIFASAPPPLSPGKRYSWFVFNNYGNNPAYTSAGMALPAFFSVPGQLRPIPQGIFPEEDQLIRHTDRDEHSDSIGRITFKWTNLDPNALLYRVFLYTEAEMDEISAQVLIWSGEVMAGQFKDTAFLTMTAANILSENKYTWRVVAMYPNGTGQAGELNTFRYSAPSGQIVVRTFEEMQSGSQRFVQNLALAQIDLEVLDGLLEATFLFFTDNNGWGERVRSIGRMRITAKKDGYESASQIIQVHEGGDWKRPDGVNWINGWGAEPTEVNLFLRRPFSSIFGRVVDSVSRAPVNLANITAVSDNGDTVRTQSLPDGNFVLNCGSGDWTVIVSRQGFMNSAPRRINLRDGQNEPFGDVLIERINNTLSGTVQNEDGQPITGATVRVFNTDRVEVAALLSTPSDGRFSFALATGRYILAVNKSGLAPRETEIEFSSSQNRVVVLERGAAMLSGTLYGISWIGNQQVRAALTNARVEIIDPTKHTDSNTVAVGATDRVYGTFSITVPVPESATTQYRMRFSAEGFNSDSVNTNAPDGIRDGFTHTQNFEISAFASINGQVIPATGLSPQGVSVSLVGANNSALVRTDNNGNFSFFRVPNGDYTLSASGQRQTMDNATLITESGNITSTTVKIKNGRFITNDGAYISEVNISTKEANATIVWTAPNVNRPTGDDSSTISFTVFSPLVRTLENGVLNYAAADVNYLLRATSSNPHIITLLERAFIFESSDFVNDIANPTVNMPFRYEHDKTTTTTNNNTTATNIEINVGNLQGANIISAEVVSRIRGERDSTITAAAQIQIGATTISFAIPHTSTGINIEYYFVIRTSEGRYSNATFPFSRRVPANPNIITRMELLPNTGGDALVLPLNGRIEIAVKAFYGANFSLIENLNANDFTFSSDNNIIGIQRTSTGAVISGNRAGNAILTVSLNRSSSFRTADDSDSTRTLTVAIEVTNSAVATISAFLQSTPENPNFILNNERVIFGIDARDGDGNQVNITPRWIIRPREAGDIIAASGEFIPKPNFIGRVHITAEINSRIRHEFSLGNERGVLIGYTHIYNAPVAGTAPRSAGTTVVSNLRESGRAELLFPVSATGTPTTLLLNNPDIQNSVMRSVENIDTNDRSRRQIISDIIEIRRHIGENLDTADVKLRLVVPQIYHRSVNANNVSIAIWDAANLRWEYRNPTPDDREGLLRAPKATYSDENNEKSLTIPIGGLINDLNTFRVAVVADGLSSGADISIRPNPFSPFVSPMSDFYHITGMNGDVKGACIIITPKGSGNTNYNPSAQVSIFNAEGTMIYNVKLEGLISGQSYYLFWDGRMQLSRTVEFEGGIHPNTALWLRGNEGSPLARNGRYFVNVTIDDGRRLHRQTREIILFK